MSSRSVVALALSLLVAGCSDDGGDDGDDGGDDGAGEPDAAPEPDGSAQPGDIGMLFVLGNQPDGSEVFVLARDGDGALDEIGSYATGGLGTGEGLGSQGAIALDDDRRHVFAVNAGSDEVSSLRIYPDHLALVDVVDSGGARPISLTAREDRLYVLNADGEGSVAGFSVEDGVLTAIDGATRPLSAAKGADPAQVQLSPDGQLLIVTEKGTSRLTTYAVAADGSLGEPVVTESSGMVPYGFAVTPSGVLVVSEAGGGPDGTSAVSSYAPASDGTLTTVSGSVASGQRAACWVALARDGRYAYVTNSQSNSITGYEVAEDGGLTLFDDEGVTVALGDGHSPIDMVVAGEGDAFLYTVAGGADVVVGAQIEADGRLTRLANDAPIPTTAVGLAGF